MTKTVMIVEDDPVALRLLEAHLTASGYRTITARDGHSALALMQRETPAMVVTDWVMPEMTGLELCQRIREFEDFGWVYTIVLTAHSDSERMIQALEAGADDFLTKPFDRRELLARLRAGERIVDLEQRLAKKNREIQRSKRGLELAYEKLANANEKLEHMARTDVLTGLANRRAAMDELGGAWAKHRDRLSCLLIDIDYFKLVNDTYGHDVGDQVLIEVARILAGTTRNDEMIFRLGGEEFLLVCPDATVRMVMAAGERMRAALANGPFAHGAVAVGVTVSVGAAQRTPEMKTIDHLIKAADDALYDAKHAGRDCIRCAPTTPMGWLNEESTDVDSNDGDRQAI